MIQDLMMKQSSALGSFKISSEGYVQGFYFEDAMSRNFLRNGILATTETIPMWAGRPLKETLHAGTNNGVLGNTLSTPTTIAEIAGFSVANVGAAGIIWTQSNIPSYGVNQTIPYLRLGSQARIALPIDATLAATLLGGTITPDLAWDFVNNKIIAWSAGTKLAVKIEDIQLTGNRLASFDATTNTVSPVDGAIALVMI